MRNLVVMDIDGVVADFERRVVYALSLEFGEEAYRNRNVYWLEKRFSNPEISKRAVEYADNPNFYYALQEIEGSLEFCERLMENGCNIAFVSSRPVSCTTFTARWLRSKFGDSEYNIYTVICGVTDKATYISEKLGDVDFVVEDSPIQIEKIKGRGYNVLCWAQSWNEGIFPRLYVRSDGELMLWSDESKESEPFWETEKNQ